MSADGPIPSQWDESAYAPFPSFLDWKPSEYDSGLVDRYEQQLRTLKMRVSEADLERALQVVNRYAAIDTGAIEGLYQVDRGFTKTVATQTAAWENALKLKGEGVKRAIDDALGAYEYVLDAVTGAVPITEVWIRELHQIICASQDSFTVHTPVGPQDHALPKGVYKVMPNSPTNASTGRVHAYAPPSQTPAEMARLIAELRTSEFQSAHPVLQAAYAHYAYVAIRTAMAASPALWQVCTSTAALVSRSLCSPTSAIAISTRWRPLTLATQLPSFVSSNHGPSTPFRCLRHPYKTTRGISTPT